MRRVLIMVVVQFTRYEDLPSDANPGTGNLLLAELGGETVRILLAGKEALDPGGSVLTTWTNSPAATWDRVYCTNGQVTHM
jgi:hypothetical protein